MPAVSKSQRNAMAAAKAGADFPLARKLRASMTLKQLAEYARTPTKHLPRHVSK